MSAAFDGGFHFGIPELLFDIALLWATVSPCRRRPCFPSWSWLGWSGEMCLDYEYGKSWLPHTFLDSVRTDSSVRVFPLVDWKKVRNDMSQIRISNSYHQYQNMANDQATLFPTGWSQRQRVRKFVKKEIENIFIHSSIPDYSFRHPYPIPLAPAGVHLDGWSTCLAFITLNCVLICKGPLSRPPRAYVSSYSSEADLEDDEGRWSGVMEPDNDEVGSCSLIAISRCIATKEKLVMQFPEMLRRSELWNSVTYEFYNVLWIEWKEGVAYRKGVGRVWKKAWERQKLKQIDAILG
jgi:hypothetical protein